MKRLCMLAVGFLCIASAVYAQEQVDADTTDFQSRLDPAFLPQTTAAGEYSQYPFLNLKANVIDLNGDDWSGLIRRLPEGILYGPSFSVVHIGDSHIQADGATGVTRKILQERYGNAGRGLITPLKMAGTNEPRDYAITSNSRWTAAKLMKAPWAAEMQFTGVAVSPMSREFDITISMLSRTLVTNPFSEIVIYYEGGPIAPLQVSSQGENLFYVPEAADGSLSILLTKSVTEVELRLKSEAKVTIAGFSLINAPNGLVYHTIGNNGATYISYNELGKMGKVSHLNPDLVVLAMGANEAFGKLSEEEFAASISRLISSISATNPSARFLLVTPMECQRRQRQATRKGRKKATYTYAVNSNIQRLRDVILRFGKEHSIPVYDFYAIAGGEGASEKWLEAELMSGDRIHNTWAGYEIQGRLLADALIDLFQPGPRAF